MTTSTSFLGDLMVSIADRGRSLLGMQDSQGDAARADVAALFEVSAERPGRGVRRGAGALKFCAFGKSWTPMAAALS